MENAEGYIKVEITTTDPVQRDLIIGIFNFTGCEFEEEHNVLAAYFRSQDYDPVLISNLLDPMMVPYSAERVLSKNWNEEWERNFTPVIVSAFCCIRASFHAAEPGVRHDIIITPRMSFGTGHHATTFLMIEQMELLSCRGRNILDFGTGTGILAILSEKLGAAKVMAIDNDYWSIENATQNIAENGCTNITIQQSAYIEGGEEFDVILANINRNVLLEHMKSISQHLKKDGVVIMSGLLTGDQEKISASVHNVGLEISVMKEREGWIVLQLVHNQLATYFNIKD